MIKVFIILQVLLSLVQSAAAEGYAPTTVGCPTTNLLRSSALGLSPEEKSWVSKRDQITRPHLLQFLQTRANLDDDEYFALLNDSNNMKIGLAFSGGGFRAMLAGAGHLSALDGRTNGANEIGLGGLLESSTYISGLSGGNWLVGSLAMNNWTSVQSIIDNEYPIWNLAKPFFEAGGNAYEGVITFLNWMKDIVLKKHAGFTVNFLDVWGRALCDVLFPADNGFGVGVTWSSLQGSAVFTSGNMPFPISVADAVINGRELTPQDSTVIEINPFEFGSWDSSEKAFTKTKYLGIEVENGQPINANACVVGYDNAGFIMGSSSNIFYNLLPTMKDGQLLADGLEVLGDMTYKYLGESRENETYQAIYQPNPFSKNEYSSLDYGIAASDALGLTDGGNDAQEIPFAPLLEPERNIDVVFAFDSSDNTEDKWPNGKSLVASYERQFSSIGSGAAFPYVPTTEVIVEEKLNKKPVFFGCDALNLTSLANVPPLVVYIANRQYSFASNTSTMKASYSDSDKLGMIQNGFETATRNNMTDDSHWATCVGCAVIRRSQERMNKTQSDVCSKCFEEYCWSDKSSLNASSTPVSLGYGNVTTH
ncbi:hypothetical protein DASC09_049260 [Saccharomycopsis crataegensis]|uniref:Lysophospholipase n=1 Tax=Saccharomycopsis crataegensis TaxID=43959 RepID=A0AAV5QSA4_9ASCO|nr:hypothetical protein DASC09_049260 [Saccharomycopsis crataegensis]